MTVGNLDVIETVDSIKHATCLESHIARCYPDRIISAFLQVNTSGESNKHGFLPGQTVNAYNTVRSTCSHLNIIGLMTIGSIEQSKQKGSINEDFSCLRRLRDDIEKITGNHALELSMGMSEDFEQAVSSLNKDLYNFC